MKDTLGQAISDYHHHRLTGKLWVNNKYGPKEEMPVDVYFRDADEMPELEWIALQKCRGRIVDIGAGAGSHALTLQKMSLDITALEISPMAAEIMRLRGVAKIVREDFFAFDETGFDTLLLLMNGIGLAGTLDGLRKFLRHARKLMNPDGRLLFDSSDISYLYKGKPLPSDHYYGEIQYQYQYRKQRSDWFSWLFIDRGKLEEIAAEEGWSTEIIAGDGFDQYLAECRLIPSP